MAVLETERDDEISCDRCGQVQPRRRRPQAFWEVLKKAFRRYHLDKCGGVSPDQHGQGPEGGGPG